MTPIETTEWIIGQADKATEKISNEELRLKIREYLVHFGAVIWNKSIEAGS